MKCSNTPTRIIQSLLNLLDTPDPYMQIQLFLHHFFLFFSSGKTLNSHKIVPRQIVGGGRGGGRGKGRMSQNGLGRVRRVICD